MYVEFPEFHRCCYCIPARHGLLVWFYMKLILSIITLIPITLITLFFPFISIAERCILGMVALPGLVADIIFSIVALVGGHTKNPKLLKVYYSYSIVSLVLFIIVFLCITMFNLYVVGFFREYHPSVWQYLMWYSVVGFASVGIQIYMLLLLRSKLHILRNNCKFRFMNNAAEAEAACAMDIDDNFKWNSSVKPNNGELQDQDKLENTEENNESKDRQRELNKGVKSSEVLYKINELNEDMI